MIEILNSKQIPLSKLTANNGQIEGIPKNPRFIKNERYQKLVKSIQDNPEFLGARELIVHEHNGKYVVLCGNMRYRASKELQFDSIPCKVIPEYFSIEQIKAIIIKDNISFGDDDFDALANEWDALELEEWGFEFPDLGGDFEPEILEAQEDEYEMPEQMQVDVVLGDLIEIGEHRLLCGDSTDSDQVAKLMNGQKADMVFTDPPYNVAYEGGSKKRDAIANDKIDDFYKFLYDVYTNCFLFMNDGSPIYVAHSELERSNFTSAFVDAGFKFSSIIVWVKNNSTFSMNKDYKWKHEPIIYGWKQGKERTWKGDNKQDTVWNIDRPSRSEEHPTMKPIELCEKAIKNSSNESSLIFEPFTGSGSTMVASHQLKRKCYGMELDPKYCQVIIDRMRKLDPTLVIKINGQIYNK